MPMPWTIQRRVRLILYEGTEAQFRSQFGTPQQPKGLQDGNRQSFATKISVHTLPDDRVADFVDLYFPDLDLAEMKEDE